jgi:hypothetical protein
MTPVARVRAALAAAFAIEHRMRTIILIALGAPLAMVYMIALPAERYGAFSLQALALLTPAEAVAALVLGFGTMLAFALQAAAGGIGRRGEPLTLGGLLVALAPAGLCCTGVIPAILAALGASTPVLLRESGRYASFFAQYADLFVAGGVALVVLSVWLASARMTSACTTCPAPGVRPLRGGITNADDETLH